MMRLLVGIYLLIDKCGKPATKTLKFSVRTYL